ncbi:MAG: hypothetical protein WCO03_02475, partial [bacterium]
MRISKHIFRVLRVVIHFSQTLVTRSLVRVSLAVVLLILATFSLSFAAFSHTINYQGKLTGSNNIAVADGNYNLTFRLYTTSTGGSPVWTETLTTTNTVNITSGLFSVMLGSIVSLDSVDFNQPLYLGIEVGGTSSIPVWDGEMSPRKQLGAVPNAFNAVTLDGLATTSFLRSDVSNATGTINNFNSLVSYITSLFFDNASGTNATTTNLYAGNFTLGT